MSNDGRIYIVDVIISARRTFRYLLSKWWIIGIAGVFGGFLGITYAWLKKPSYTAELIFSSETGADASLSGYAGLAAQFGFNLGGGGSGGAFEGDNLIELLRSNSMVQQTLLSDAIDSNSHPLMIDAYLANHELNKGWSEKPNLKNIRFVKNPAATPERNRDSVLKAVTKSIIDDQLNIYKLDKKLNYIVVQIKDVNELFAKEFVEKLMANASEFYVEYRSKKAQKNYQLISKMTDSIKGLLYGNIESYASTNDLNINPIRQQVRAGSQKIQINAQANTALYSELLQQLGLAKVTLQKETPLIQVIDSPLLPLKKEKPGRLRTGIIFSFFSVLMALIILLISKWLNSATSGLQKEEYTVTQS